MDTSDIRVPVGNLVFNAVVSGGGVGSGDEPRALLLHGFPETSASWRPLMARLDIAGVRAVAPDQRGYSPDARPTEVDAYAMDHLVDNAVGILDTLGLASVNVVGHDWGAVVAWNLADRHPERVRTLTAVSVPHPAAFAWALAHDADQQRRSEYIGFFRQPGRAEGALLADDARALRGLFGPAVDSGLVESHVRALSAPGALTAALSWYRALPPGGMPRTGSITVPTTYVWSDGDIALGRAGAERCADHVRGPYTFVELAGVSHWIPEEAPDALAAAVVARIRG